MNTNVVTFPVRSFASQVLYFNGMCKLPIAPFPNCGYEVSWQKEKFPFMAKADDIECIIKRMEDFKKIMQKELDEADDIIEKLKAEWANQKASGSEPLYSAIAFLTDLADWLGDITVYCRSESERYGIPMDDVLSIIMQSNFSKLGVDGQPIYDENGKVCKGPFYWKPEPKIQALLEERMKVVKHSDQMDGEAG